MDFLPPPDKTEAPTPTKKGVEYRELTPEEVSTLEPIFAERNVPMPDPAWSTFTGCVKDGEVLGFLVTQVKIHAEPMWIKEGHSSIFKSLVSATEKTVLRKVGPAWVYLFAPPGNVTELAQAMGMTLEPWSVLSKLVTPNIPVKPIPFIMDLEDMPVDGEPI